MLFLPAPGERPVRSSGPLCAWFLLPERCCLLLSKCCACGAGSLFHGARPIGCSGFPLRCLLRTRSRWGWVLGRPHWGHGGAPRGARPLSWQQDPGNLERVPLSGLAQLPSAARRSRGPEPARTQASLATSPVVARGSPGSFQGPPPAPLCLGHPHSRPRQAHSVD